MKRLKIIEKVRLIVFSLCMALLILMSAVVLAMSSLKESVAQIGGEELNALLLARETHESFKKITDTLQISVSVADPTIFQETDDTFYQIASNLNKLTKDRVHLLPIEPSAALQLLSSYRANVSKYLSASISASSENNHLDTAAMLKDDAEKINALFLSLRQGHDLKFSNKLSALGHKTREMLMIISTIAVAFALVAAVLLSRFSAELVRRLSALTSHFVNTNLQTISMLPPDPQNDELSDLLDVSNQMLFSMQKSKKDLVNFQFVKDVFDSLRDGVCVVHETDYAVAWYNPSFLRMFFLNEGRQIEGETLDALLGRHGVQINFSSLQAAESDVLGKEFEIGSGESARSYLVSSWKTVLNNKRVLLVSFSDVTAMFRIKKEKQEIELQLLHASKLSSLGTLGAGLAHELNNPLASIIGYTSMIQKKDLSVSRQREILEKIQLNSNRMRQVIDHMRSFARDSRNTERALCAIDTPITNAFMILETQLEMNSIEVQLELSHRLLSFLGDATEIESVLQNLISNSRDAFLTQESMPSDFQRKISLQVKETTKQIIITYRDNAGGIPESIRNKIFEPFFTTKEVGKGTGIGLSISYRFMQNHGGTIAVDCPSPGITEFLIVLPLASSAERTAELTMELNAELNEDRDTSKDDHTLSVPSDPSITSASRRAENSKNIALSSAVKPRVVWIDDEQNLLELIEEMLGEGFEITTYSEPAKALKDILGNPPDIVITDMRMPKLSGIQVVTEIRRHLKNIPILVASGHANNDQDALKVFAAGVQAVLSKPLPSEEHLVETILSFLSAQTKPVVFLIGKMNSSWKPFFEQLSEECVLRTFDTVEDALPRLRIEYPQNIICALSPMDKSFQKLALIQESLLPTTPLIGIGQKNASHSELACFSKLGFQVFTEENLTHAHELRDELMAEICGIIFRNQQSSEKKKKSA